MKRVSALLLAGLAIISPIFAEDAAPQMIVEPSATKVSLAKANLIVSPLDHQEQAYMGSYRLDVTPFSFKNEKGSLFLNAPDETVRKMSGGEPVEFTGKATNAKNGIIKVIKGKTTPSTRDRGLVSFSVQTENGVMVFNTSYHLVRR